MISDKPIIRSRSEVEPVPCPCGLAARIITKEDKMPVSLHAVTIKRDSEVHYHLRQTEIYYVLKGQGSIYLDGKISHVQTGSVICIPPGVKHRAIGELEIINIVHPPFDSDDEYLEETRESDIDAGS